MTRLLRLLSLYRPYLGWMALGIFASLATLLANVTLMAVSGWFIASMALAGAAQVSMNYFTPAAIIRAAAIVRTGGRYLERLVTHEATFRLLARLRVWLYRRIEPLAPGGLQGHHSGDLLSRIRADIDTLDKLYLGLLVPAGSAALGTLVITLYLASYDSRIALLLLLLLLAAGIGLPLLTLRLGKWPGQRKVSLLAEQRSMLVDTTQGLAELLLYGAQQRHLDRLVDNSRELAGQQARLSGTNGLSQAGLLLAANLALWSVLWLAIPMVEQGTLPKADLAMLSLLSLAAFEAVMPLPAAMQGYGEIQAAAQRLFEITDSEPVLAEPVDEGTQPVGHGIRFDKVSFSYPGSQALALDQLSFEVPEGERITIVGRSGSGKSSLIQLLVRFYQPQQGSILLGDVPLERLNSETLRNHIAVVPQETHLFTGSVRDNLLLGRPDAPSQAIESACRVAQVDQVIRRLPQGYDTWVGEAGASLSGGEARRIAIARALLKEAPVLVLDEPTEGLDPSTAARLLSAIDQWASGRTVILITHQARHNDRFGTVWLMERGRLRSAPLDTEKMGSE